jgi:methylmalonyl-CoA/ethylmalonyl-CoA epimerase
VTALRSTAAISRVHHIGIVVKDIAETAEMYVRRYGFELCSPIIHDPVQTAHVQFLKLPAQSIYVELVAPDSGNSKLTNSLQKGGGLNHICYETRDIHAACEQLRAEAMIVLQRPVPAVAFSGRLIAWLMGTDRVPVELVEGGADIELAR